MPSTSKNLKNILSWYEEIGIDENITFLASNKLIKLDQEKKINLLIDSLGKNTIPNKAESLLFNEKELTQSNKNIVQESLQNIKEARAIANDSISLNQLKQEVVNFNGCKLKNYAKNTVFGDGVSNAEIMLIGEAPGEQEDIKGVPFCGKSGMLLEEALKAINLSRHKNFYITNTVFWRPPGNRKPEEEELSICRPFVEKHIALIKPKLLILVGSVAASALLNNTESMSKLRQNDDLFYTNSYLDYKIKVFAIFHPSYLLRNPISKKQTWFDLLKIEEYILSNNINLKPSISTNQPNLF